MVVKARTYADGQWSALTEAVFTSAPPPLRITEVMYHPRLLDEDAPFEDDDFEFIELANTSASDTVNLEGVAFTAGVDFTFPAVSLAPGERIAVVRNQVAFEHRYGADRYVAGQYGETPDGPKLDNAGEILRLEDAQGGLIQEFAYDDAWVAQTDGEGQSLTIVNAQAALLDWNNADAWRASYVIDGSPGIDDDVDFNQDGFVNVIDVDLLCSGQRRRHAIRFNVRR